MRPKSLIAAFLSIAAMSCVDKDFQLDKVSTEVAIGGQVTTIPLGYLEKQRLGDIIDLDSANGLTIDKDGNYSLTFDGEESEITIEGVENRFNIAKTMTSFSTEYPAFDITPAKLVTGIITDRGVFSPENLHNYYRDDDAKDFPSA